MTRAVRRQHLADAADWRRRGGRGRFIATLCVVAAAHLLVLARIPAAPAPPLPSPQQDAVSLDLTPPSFLAAAPTPTQTPPPPAPPQPAASPPDALPPATPPAPPQPAPSQMPTAATMPPVDPTAEPAPLTPAPAGAPPPPAGPVAVTPLSASTCDLTGVLQAAFQGDPKVHDELALIPRQARSVANAVQLWDGVWVDPRAVGGPAIADPIRAAIVAVVSQAPAGCHDQPVLGPRLFAVVDPRGTIVVALGSGQWKWTDLLDPPAAASPSPQP